MDIKKPKENEPDTDSTYKTGTFTPTLATSRCAQNASEPASYGTYKRVKLAPKEEKTEK